jgi:hypothetical protein
MLLFIRNLILCFVLLGMTSCTPTLVTTDAFIAQEVSDNWTIQLKPEYFFPEVTSVSVTYGYTLYGIYLPNDKLIIPRSDKTKNLILKGYDVKGKLLIQTTFTLPAK